MLAYEIDRGARVTRPRHQPVGATHHLDPIIDRRIQCAFAEVPTAVRVERGNTIVLIAVDTETARIKIHATAVDLARRDARGAGEDIFDILQILILDPLLGHDTDRLRDLLLAQIESRAGGRGLAGIAHVLVEIGRRDGHRTQPGGRIAGLAECCRCQQQGSRGKQRQRQRSARHKTAFGQDLDAALPDEHDEFFIVFPWRRLEAPNLLVSTGDSVPLSQYWRGSVKTFGASVNDYDKYSYSHKRDGGYRSRQGGIDAGSR